MDTVEQAVDYLRHNDTPFWWVKSGNSKIGDNTKEEDLNASIDLFRKTVQFLPAGTYKLECSRKANDRSGSYMYPFSKGQTSPTQPATNTTMQSGTSTNAYGIPDHVYAQIQQEAKQRFMFEQMYGEFTAFMKDWPELKKKIERIERIEAYLKDEDGDGTPDFLQIAKTASDTMEGVSTIKKAFEGGSGFRFS